MKNGWNGQLAHIWTKMVGPSRPTISELSIYTKWVKKLQQITPRKLKLLILGSTPEFRDWGYENNYDITVMDCNPDYNKAIFREIRHKCIKENFVHEKWQNLTAIEEYDVIIGDLAVGNIPPEDLEKFIKNVSIALTQNGLYLGKSFYNKKDYVAPSPRELVENYYMGPPWHPYSALTYDLTINCIDENNMLSFSKQYAVLEELNREGILKNETFEYFKGVGWDKDMKFLFHVPDLDEYESLLQSYLHIYAIEYGDEIYSSHFPLHIVGRKNNELFLKEKKQ